MLAMMNMKGTDGAGNNAPLRSLVSRGYLIQMAFNDMPKKIRLDHQGRRGGRPVFYTLTSAGLAFRRALANVQGTGNHLGLVATGAQPLSME
jgi:hypothetical protein